ncbi:hypothetical protein L6164_001429 [Bauhinia variegata]|uniref:Uncharacterized protein n=1 Tax=Bauhinia variegata TaxID=167791 RepID=A0ACB9QCC4_BAUVA|nr:hypothetical protein L6164_001429 [Bauhinia variegata]
MEKPQLGFGVSVIFRFVLVFSLVLSASSGDAEVMNNLRKMIRAPPNLGWSDPDFCEWQNIKCNSDKRVTSINIAKSNLAGSLPENLVNLSELKALQCFDNKLTGPFPKLAPSVKTLTIYNNGFSSIPSDFFEGMSMLEEVRIGANPFSAWRIPDSLKDCTSLRVLEAQNCSIIGSIPDIFGPDNPLPALVNLTLSYNLLEGGFPASFAGTGLEFLLLNDQKSTNKLNGTLGVLQKMKSLKQIWVHGNQFTGPIPDFSKHDQLFDVNLRDNQLTGVVPSSLTSLKSLRTVKLSNNRLQGSPPVFPPGVQVDMTGLNQFCTNMPGQPCSALVNAMLSVAEPLGYPLKFAESWKGNDPCSGSWTGIVCSNKNISVINFQRMGLSGTISPSFSSLTSVVKLLLADNNLGGTIPRELTSMPNLVELDVSNNNLYGKVPTFRQGVSVEYTGNKDIGKDRPSSPSGLVAGGKGLGVGPIVGIVVAIVVLLGVGAAAFIMFRRKRKDSSFTQKPNGKTEFSRDSDATRITVSGGGGPYAANDSYVGDASNMVITIQVLREVTNNFSEQNILGKGGFGSVYKGELHDGTKIAVKRMESGMVGEKWLNEFMAEIAVLTKVRHRHLVALLGYCLDGNERLLVYEYMPQGTLNDHLFNWKVKGFKPLEWKRRLSIALDVARGVEYLHNLAQQIFIHRDLKPSNILLGDDMHAKVADFGLVRLVPEGNASFETRIAGTFGYLAPEYATTGRVTTKVDVFSFGVVLMEMISGRKALDNSQSEENVHLVSWFRRVLINKDIQNAIDPTIVLDEETYSSICVVAELAGHCCTREPHNRPDMSHAVNVLLPLVEVWKPTEAEREDDNYGFDPDLSLPQALERWQAMDGRSNVYTNTASLSYPTSEDSINTNTEISTPPRPPGLADSLSSRDGR